MESSPHTITKSELYDAGFPENTRIGMIWAQSTAGVIGDGSDMPWHLPEDLKHFKRTTAGSPVVMGRLSWESLPEVNRPLPGRANIVVTSDSSYTAPGATVVTTVADALVSAGEQCDNGTVWVMGGGTVYRQCMGVADSIVVTEIDCDAPANHTVTAPSVPGTVYTVVNGPWLRSDRGSSLAGGPGLRYRVREFTRRLQH